jgi:hypothetical protein
MEAVLVHCPLAQHSLGTGSKKHHVHRRSSLVGSPSFFTLPPCFMSKPSLTETLKPFTWGFQTSVLPKLGSQKQSFKQRRFSRLHVAFNPITSETRTAAPSPVEYDSWQNGRHGVVFSTEEMLGATGRNSSDRWWCTCQKVGLSLARNLYSICSFLLEPNSACSN